jgi:hypothetical protein
VPLDDITADSGCVARAQLLGHAQSLTRSGIAHIAHMDLETMGLQVFDPQMAATTVGVFPDLDRGHLRKHGFLQESARYKRESSGLKPLTSLHGDCSGFLKLPHHARLAIPPTASRQMQLAWVA